MRGGGSIDRSAATVAVLQGCAVYNMTSQGADAELMLLGYDPVSYFRGSSADEGAQRSYGAPSPRHLSIQLSREPAKFIASPDRYAPQYGAFCAKGVSYAIRAGGDPLAYEIRSERLFIFVNDYARDYWRTDPDDFIAKADAYWAPSLKTASEMDESHALRLSRAALQIVSARIC